MAGSEGLALGLVLFAGGYLALRLIRTLRRPGAGPACGGCSGGSCETSGQQPGLIPQQGRTVMLHEIRPLAERPAGE